MFHAVPRYIKPGQTWSDEILLQTPSCHSGGRFSVCSAVGVVPLSLQRLGWSTGCWPDPLRMIRHFKVFSFFNDFGGLAGVECHGTRERKVAGNLCIQIDMFLRYGFDVVKKFLDGARAMDVHFKDAPIEKILAMHRRHPLDTKRPNVFEWYIRHPSISAFSISCGWYTKCIAAEEFAYTARAARGVERFVHGIRGLKNNWMATGWAVASVCFGWS